MIKNKLHILLAERYMKMSELSRATGLTEAVIYRLYHNTSKGYTFDQINRICNALKITPNELLEYTPD